MATIEERVKRSLSKQLSVTFEEIHLDSHIVDDLGADSLDVVESIMILEDEFDCLISDEFIEGFSTVNDIVEWLKDNYGES